MDLEGKKNLKEMRETMEEKLYSRNWKRYGFDLNPFVSFGTAIIVVALVIYAIVANFEWFGLSPADETLANLRLAITERFDWLFILITNFFILLAIFLAFSRLGRVRLGGMQSKPEFSNFAWYSMLLSAGMGIGLMFWAVGEPLNHFNTPGPIYEGASSSVQAMSQTFLHWGLHPWAIYAVMGLSLAFFAYNKKLPLSLRSIFYPVFKDRVFGRLGDVIDLIAVLATLFGLATSLGLGVQQINSGLGHLIGIPVAPWVQVVLIAVITAIATISIISGIDKGVRILSGANMRMAFVFMIAILLLGPTFFIFRLFASSLGSYLNDFLGSALYLSLESGEGRDWQGAWTIFYLAWWVSWSPFVGMFIARVSRGRTVREFIIAVLLIPSLISFIWLSVFGGTAFSVNEATNGALYATVTDNLPVALFELIDMLNIQLFQGIIVVLLSVLATIIIIFFFITSSDSGSIVINAITSGGKTKTKARQRVFWAVIEGLIAAILILIGGERALQTLQDAVIMTGLPFVILLLFMSIILLVSLSMSYQRQQHKRDVRKLETLIAHTDITYHHEEGSLEEQEEQEQQNKNK